MAVNQVREGDRYRSPVGGCGCEIIVDRAPDVGPTREFVDRPRHRMAKAT